MNLTNVLDDINRKEEISRRQKRRVNWVREGDVNTRFFHKVVNGKRRRSLIKELEIDESRIVTDNDVIAEEVTRFFKDLYSEDVRERPFLEGLD